MDFTNLDERRRALGLDLRTLSERSGVSYGSCWNYCRGGRETRAILYNYLKVAACLDRLEKELKEKQEDESCQK